MSFKGFIESSCLDLMIKCIICIYIEPSVLIGCTYNSSNTFVALLSKANPINSLPCHFAVCVALVLVHIHFKRAEVAPSNLVSKTLDLSSYCNL